MRAPGLTMFRLPTFTWATLSTSFLVVLAIPVVTAALVMLLSDRRFGPRSSTRRTAGASPST